MAGYPAISRQGASVVFPSFYLRVFSQQNRLIIYSGQASIIIMHSNSHYASQAMYMYVGATLGDGTKYIWALDHHI